MKKKVTVRNYKFVCAIVTLFLIVAIVRLGMISLSTEIDGMNIEAFANSRNTVSKTLYASRGNIYDIYGEHLAETVNSYTVIAYLEESRTESEDEVRHVQNIEATAEALAPVLEISKEELMVTLSKDKYQVELKRNITELTKSKIDELELDGIGFDTSVTRYYQSGSFASYLVGYAKADDENHLTGELGIEGYYDDILKGVDGTTSYQQDAYGYKIPNVPEYTTEAVSGSDIYLTIDSNIQLILENAVNKIKKEYTSEWAIMTVIDANTGAIVGSATSPSYNPNDLNTLTNYLNPLISYSYEPGSTMKAFSFASAIEEGIYDGNETFTSGSIEVADVTISDFNKYGWGDITYDTGFAYSSNVGTTMLALELGANTLTDYYDLLGFGKTTDIELSGEIAGTMDFYYQSELANASFGQGMSVTPIQLLQAYTVFTNSGTMIKPYIVDKIVDENGNITYEGGREEVAKVFDDLTTDYMQNLLYNAVYNGTSNMWQPENVTIMGKTGTAQIASPTGGYLEGDTNVIRSFMNIFPKEDPEYILYMAVKQYTGPTSNLSDYTTTAIEEIASYAKITDEEIDHKVSEKIEINNLISSKTSEVKAILESKGLNVVVIGDGNYITNQFPLKNSVLFKGDKIFLKTNSSNILVPNLIGYSANEIKTIATLMGININIEGYGYVVSQNLPEYHVLTTADSLSVVLG